MTPTHDAIGQSQIHMGPPPTALGLPYTTWTCSLGIRTPQYIGKQAAGLRLIGFLVFSFAYKILKDMFFNHTSVAYAR